MPAISPADRAVYQTYPHAVKRYLAVAPMDIELQAQVFGWPTYGGGSVIGFIFDTPVVGVWSNIKAGMTVWVGTTQGANDIGVLRVRKDSTTNKIWVGETAQSAAPVEPGHWVTVFNQRRIWERKPRIVGQKTGGSQFVNDFTGYEDFEIAYTNQNDYPPPLVVIDGAMAGFVDSGQTYRTMTLTASRSSAVYPGSVISGYQWALDDCTLISGLLTDDTITIRVPARDATYGFATPFRYVSCTVTGPGGATATGYYPLFAYDATSRPLEQFEITRDETVLGAGREMELTLFGQPGDLNDFQEGALMVYWEEATFGPSGTAAPDSYRYQFMAWALSDVHEMEHRRGQYRLSLGGPAAWLDRIDGQTTTFTYDSAPGGWSEMATPTDERAMLFLLQWHSNAAELCGVIPTRWPDPWKNIAIQPGSLWQQLKQLAKEFLAEVSCDSNGVIHIARHPFYMDDSDRDAIATVIDLETEEVAGEPVTVERALHQRVGLVIADGACFNGGTSIPYRAQAPGEAAGHGVGKEQMQAVVLNADANIAYLQIRDIAGHRLAHLNPALEPFTVELTGNYDFLCVGLLEWITLAAAITTFKAIDLSQYRFIVKRVSVRHNTRRGQPPKVISWELEVETQGRPGIGVALPANDIVVPYNPPAGAGNYYTPDLWAGFESPEGWERMALPRGVDRMAAITREGVLLRTSAFRTTAAANGPIWDAVDLTALGIDSRLDQVCEDPFSHLAADGQIDIYLTTMGNNGTSTPGWLWRVDDIFGTPVATQLKQFSWVANGSSAPAWPMGRHLDASFAEDWVLVVTYYWGHGTYAVYKHGATISSEIQITPYVQGDSAVHHEPALYISPKTAGKAYTQAFTNSYSGGYRLAKTYVTTDYGASWSQSGSPSFESKHGLGADYAIPYVGNDDERIGYYTEKTQTGGGVQTYRILRSNADGSIDDVTPQTDGHSFGCRWSRWALVSGFTNVRHMAVIGAAQYPTEDRNTAWLSANGGEPWELLTGPINAIPYRRVAIGGNDANILYLWGEKIFYSSDWGATLDERTGNIYTDNLVPAGDEILALVGG